MRRFFFPQACPADMLRRTLTLHLDLFGASRSFISIEMVARTIFDTVVEVHAIFDMVDSGHAAHRCACDKDAVRCKAAGNDMDSEKGEGWFFMATEHRLFGRSVVW